MSKAIKTSELDQKASFILQEICNAFKGVTLGQGIGLREANGLDDYSSDESCAALRLLDEKQDWLKISANEINDFWWGFAHLNAEGMRFHLPAILKCDLEQKYQFDLPFTLTQLDDWGKQRFSLLGKEQKKAVAAYLVYKINALQKIDRDISEIKKALNEYWLLDPDNTVTE